MAGAKKHMERSHRSHNNKVDYRWFESKAKMKAYSKENKSWLSQFLGKFKRGDR